MNKVLIFTEQVGEGHLHAAKAIEKAFHSYGKGNVITKIITGTREIHPWLEFMMISMYFLCLRLIPKLWRILHTRTKKETWFQRQFFAHRLAKIVQDEDPDLIICTHASCVPALSHLKHKHSFRFKLGVVMTDYGYHPYFIQEKVDYYFVSHQDLKDELVQNHSISKEKIYNYGIPIDPKFDQNAVNGSNVIPFKDKQIFHILVMGGATGYGPVEKVIRAFQLFSFPYKLTIITGRNKKLYKKLSPYANQSVQILGYVQDIDYWLRMTDLIITKPGGLTVTEAMSCGTPLVLINPIPGHEEKNQTFLVKKEVAEPVNSVHQIPFLVLAWQQKPHIIKEWKRRIEQFYQKDAAHKIVKTLLQEPNQKSEKLSVPPNILPVNSFQE